MISTRQIREAILAFLSDNDVDKFALNFASLSHNIHKEGDSDAIELANKIEFKLAALDSGFISLPGFRECLRALVPAPIVTAYQSNRPVTTSTTRIVINSGWAAGWPVASSIQFVGKKLSLAR